MRLAHIEIPDDLAAAADRLWPDATWGEVLTHALGLAVADTEHAADDVHELAAAAETDLEARIRAAFPTEPAQ